MNSTRCFSFPLRAMTGALCLGLVLASSVANAADATRERQETYRQAHAAMDAQRWPDARRLLLEVWSQSPTYDIASSLGEVEFALKNYASAARYYAYALENLAPKEKQSVAEGLRSDLAQVKALVGTVRVIVKPEGAEVFVDGERAGVAPLRSEVFLDPGTHAIEARLGDRRATKTIRIGRGEMDTLHFSIPDAAGPTSPGSLPELPGSGIGSTETPPQKSLVPVIVGASVAAIGLVTWVAFDAAASSREDDIRQVSREVGPYGCLEGTADAATCSRARSLRDDQQSNVTTSRVGLGVGVVATLATVGYWLLWPEPASEPQSVRADVRVDGSSGTFVLSGRF